MNISGMYSRHDQLFEEIKEYKILFHHSLLSFNSIKIIFCSSEVEKTSTFWRDVALIAGATIAGIAAVAIIVGLAVAAKRGKLPGMKSSGPKKRRLSVSSLSSSSSSSDESDKESSNKRKRPKTALRSKTKVRLPPVKSAKVETLPKVSIKGQSKLPPIAKK